MEPKAAAEIIYAEEIKGSADGAALVEEKAESYRKLQGSGESAAKRGYIDNIIQPEETRKHLAFAFDMLFTKRESRPSRKHGTV